MMAIALSERTATFVRLKPCTRPCSACAGHARYDTASGYGFCAQCWRRYLLVRVAQVHHGAGWIEYARSAPMCEVALALYALRVLSVVDPVAEIDDIDRRSAEEQMREVLSS